MGWSSEFHSNPNHSKDLQGVQIDFSLLTTNPALFNVSNTKLGSALQLLRSKYVPQPSSKYNTIRIPCLRQYFTQVFVKKYGAEVKLKGKTENT